MLTWTLFVTTGGCRGDACRARSGPTPMAAGAPTSVGVRHRRSRHLGRWMPHHAVVSPGWTPLDLQRAGGGRRGMGRPSRSPNEAAASACGFLTPPIIRPSRNRLIAGGKQGSTLKFGAALCGPGAECSGRRAARGTV